MIVGGIIYWVVDAMRYRRKIPIYSNINGKTERSLSDKARIVKLGTGGEIVWYLKKKKRMIVPGIKQTGRQVFPHFETEDGDLINFDFGNLDFKLRQMGVNFTDPAMRMARVNIQRNTTKKYQKVTFMDKYGTIMIFTIHIIIISIMFVYILGNFNKVADSLKQVADSLKETIILANNMRGNSTASLVPVK